MASSQRRELEKKTDQPSRKTASVSLSVRAPHHLRTVWPPNCFSLLNNAGETAKFLNLLSAAIPKSAVFVEFGLVTKVTPEAALVLIATLKKFPKRKISGSIPQSEPARTILIQSGFFDHVRHSVNIGTGSQGEAVRYSGREVDGALARRLIFRGTELTFGVQRDSEPAYCVLLEGMQNTIDHAHFTQGETPETDKTREDWWAFVYADTERKRVCFALADVGVGILKSARVKRIRKLGLVLKTTTHAELIKKMLDGEFQSRTGLDNRGKGLPTIRALSDSGSIRELTLISNSVLARVCANEFSIITEGFNGTLLYWEIEQ